MTCQIHVGDALDWLRSLPSGSVHLCVTSPPYWRMRDYNVAGQYGLEDTLHAYLANQVAVFREVYRVLRPDGSLWLNVGDGYKDRHLLGLPWRLALALQADGWLLRSDTIWHKPNAKPESVKDRPGTAHEYVFLLAKSEIYYYDWWAVREPQSESERTRRLREQEQGLDTIYRLRRDGISVQPKAGKHGIFRSALARQAIASTGMRNLRSVWTIPTRGLRGEHFATYPVDLATRCILAGTSEYGCCALCGAPYVRQFTRTLAACIADPRLKAEGIFRIRNKEYEPLRPTGAWAKSCPCTLGGIEPCTVIDPYTGAGTTAIAAKQFGRSFAGAELNPDYASAARLRISADSTNKKRNETR